MGGKKGSESGVEKMLTCVFSKGREEGGGRIGHGDFFWPKGGEWGR